MPLSLSVLMASSSLNQSNKKQQQSKNSKLAFAFGFLFLLSLVGVICFSKRSLEPSTLVYADPSLSSNYSHLLPSNSSHVPETSEFQNNGSSAPVASDGGGSVFVSGDLEKVEVTQITKSNLSVEDGSSISRTGVDEESSKVMCDLYSGSWVRFEDGDYPLYSPGSCPYVDDAYTCLENGRKDRDYLKWRWKPHGCELPRFNATDFLERIRGKRLMLVGDSMNRNQFESLLCLLREALPDKSKMYETRGYKITKGRGYFIFKFEDYNCTVEFCRSHFLVREGTSTNPKGKSRPILMIDRIGKSSSRWKRADILIFNTGHWWTHGKTSKGKDYYQEGGIIYPKFDAVEAYKKAMRTWARWIDTNMNPKKNLVFYRGYSTAHFRGGDWDSGGTCNGESEPMFTGKLLDNYPLKMRIMEEVVQEMKFPVILLNVTKLTNFRKDGHPSIYGKNRTEGERVSARKQDCSHWCLPGVPDAWNELIYANLVLNQMQALLEKKLTIYR